MKYQNATHPKMVIRPEDFEIKNTKTTQPKDVQKEKIIASEGIQEKSNGTKTFIASKL